MYTNEPFVSRRGAGTAHWAVCVCVCVCMCVYVYACVCVSLMYTNVPFVSRRGAGTAHWPLITPHACLAMPRPYPSAVGFRLRV